MRVFFHILRRADGTGGQPVSAVARNMNALTATYAPNQIYFQNLGYDEVRSDYYYGLTSSTADTAKYRALVTNIQRNYSALNLYLLDDTSPYNPGRANGIPGSAVAIGGQVAGQFLVGSPVLAHEVGYCLGLFQPFENRAAPQNPNGTSNELVNGTNCTTAGDYVCDTPAESPAYNFKENASCQFTVSFTDANDQTYRPDVSLLPFSPYSRTSFRRTCAAPCASVNT